MNEKTVARFWSKVEKRGSDDCWEWQGSRGCQRNGTARYGSFWLGSGRYMAAHRVAWMIANGMIPPRMLVCHRCDNGLCCNPTHLFLGTARDNTQDMVAKGRRRGGFNGSLRGEQQHLAKLTEVAVVEIRRRHAAGEGALDLAAEYGVHFASIYKVLKRKTWKHC